MISFIISLSVQQDAELFLGAYSLWRLRLMDYTDTR